jgi:RNA polymerase sigma-70 factor (ECF subfamily)
MARVAAGDETAFAELVTRWQKPVLAHVARFLGCSADEARDVAQEAFLRVWRERRRWRPRAAFSTWLFAVVLNLCRNQRRSVRRRPEVVPFTVDDHGEPLPVVPAGVADDPFARARGAELARIAHRALLALPDNQRAAVLLRRFEGMSYREIAAVLDLSEAAVESLLVRARRALAAAILGADRAPAQETEGAGVELRREG